MKDDFQSNRSQNGHFLNLVFKSLIMKGNKKPNAKPVCHHTIAILYVFNQI
jgi:hypothetical protein